MSHPQQLPPILTVLLPTLLHGSHIITNTLIAPKPSLPKHVTGWGHHKFISLPAHHTSKLLSAPMPSFPSFYPPCQTFIKEPWCFIQATHTQTPSQRYNTTLWNTPRTKLPSNTGLLIQHPTIITATFSGTFTHIKPSPNTDKSTPHLPSSLLLVWLWLCSLFHAVQHGTCQPCNSKHAIFPCYCSPDFH